MINNNLLLENILTLFDQAEELLNQIRNKVKNNDFFFETDTVKSLQITKELWVVFEKREKEDLERGGEYQIENKTVVLYYTDNILEEWPRIKIVFLHEYTHHVGFTRTKNIESFRKEPPEGKKKKFRTEAGIDKDKNIDNFLNPAELVAYANDILYHFYEIMKKDFYKKINEWINGCLMGTIDINDVEKKIEVGIDDGYEVYKETLEPRHKAQINIRKIERHMGSQLRKIKKRLYDIFLERYYEAEFLSFEN